MTAPFPGRTQEPGMLSANSLRRLLLRCLPQYAPSSRYLPSKIQSMILWNKTSPDQASQRQAPRGQGELWHLQSIIMGLDCMLGFCVLIRMESVQLTLHKGFADKLPTPSA